MAENILHFPIDESATFSPTRILYLRPGQSTTHCEILDVTNNLKSSYRGDPTPELLELAQITLRANPTLAPTWTFSKKSKFSKSHLSVFEQPGDKEIAHVNSHFLSFGTSHVHFPPDLSNTTHDITVKPLSIKSRAQSFVKDSVPYAWQPSRLESEQSSKAGDLSLFKALARKKIEVAKYASVDGKFELNGLLLIDEREVDAVVTVLTLVSVLGQSDTFYAFGIDLIGK